jgi:hypothetical protein
VQASIITIDYFEQKSWVQDVTDVHSVYKYFDNTLSSEEIKELFEEGRLLVNDMEYRMINTNKQAR